MVSYSCLLNILCISKKILIQLLITYIFRIDFENISIAKKRIIYKKIMPFHTICYKYISLHCISKLIHTNASIIANNNTRQTHFQDWDKQICLHTRKRVTVLTDGKRILTQTVYNTSRLES